jgi:poly-beta-1,6-N-acetyl-D-glucosamine N-deacetylase
MSLDCISFLIGIFSRANGSWSRVQGILGWVLASLLIAASPCPAADTFLTLVYHDIPETPVVNDDISRKDFLEQLEFLKYQGFTFVSPDQILAAKEGKAVLPEKAVLLTFDDAYVSFYAFVFPVLKRYGAPAVLSVVPSWIEYPGTMEYRDKRFMNWREIREVADSGLVTIASHSWGLHRMVQSNPVGNMEPAPATFTYLPALKRYETDEEFRERVRTDLVRSIDVLTVRLGKRPRILTWPYGVFNQIGIEEARKLGFEMILTLEDGYSSVSRLDRLNRYYLQTEVEWPSLFKENLAEGFQLKTRIRAVQIDLDMIVNKNSLEESDRNLGLLIDRLVNMGVNTVFLQGFCDAEGTGNVRSLYFHNSVLPVEMDFLGHAVNRIQLQEIKVYVWMPVLSFELPDKTLNEALKVRGWKDGKPVVTSSWYRRLSPFDPRSLETARKIFRDLAAIVHLDGILIQDDAYLAETEDFHPAAVESFRMRYGVSPDPVKLKADKELNARWVDFKVEALDRHIDEIAKTVRVYRPEAAFARNIYAEAVTNPESKEWFAQDLQNYLRTYDYTVVMAYKAMEGKWNSRKWYRELFKDAGGRSQAGKVIYKLQAYDWKKKAWIKGQDLKQDLTFLLSIGANHVAYYPDNVYRNSPDVKTISSILSSKSEVKREDRMKKAAP